MKSLWPIFLSACALHGGQILMLTNTDGVSKEFYVVGCTPEAVVCKHMESDKQTLEIPLAQLSPQKNTPGLQILKDSALKLSARLKSGITDVWSSAYTSVSSRDPARYGGFVGGRKSHNFENERDLIFRIRGSITSESKRGFPIVTGTVIDYNNHKTKRIEYAKDDPRGLDNKTETEGTFTVYNLLGAVGDTVDIEVFSTPFSGEYILSKGAKNFETACSKVMLPLPEQFDASIPPKNEIPTKMFGYELGGKINLSGREISSLTTSSVGVSLSETKKHPILGDSIVSVFWSPVTEKIYRIAITNTFSDRETALINYKSLIEALIKTYQLSEPKDTGKSTSDLSCLFMGSSDADTRIYVKLRPVGSTYASDRKFSVSLFLSSPALEEVAKKEVVESNLKNKTGIFE